MQYDRLTNIKSEGVTFYWRVRELADHSMPCFILPAGRSFTDFSMSTVIGIWTGCSPSTVSACNLSVGGVFETGRSGGKNSISCRLSLAGRSLTDFSMSTVIGIRTGCAPLSATECDLGVGDGSGGGDGGAGPEERTGSGNLLAGDEVHQALLSVCVS